MFFLASACARRTGTASQALERTHSHANMWRKHTLDDGICTRMFCLLLQRFCMDPVDSVTGDAPVVPGLQYFATPRWCSLLLQLLDAVPVELPLCIREDSLSGNDRNRYVCVRDHRYTRHFATVTTASTKRTYAAASVACRRREPATAISPE